ncbi:ATP-binding cassette G family transporter ABCG89 [Besnoitia besnoiti]|uniref:ATP-binding cassette G family transporter ABCG89 n=1 Tax=Besnoitia besnoiti TaxID=94643 RepID=A0A2A9M494_BESBE|nr:ATP-binding cassette G family transporter ABCG89 [Besnoitia besnoiti]PFH32044.1 ATP-binding cassette G family transporter ABCG89 [Besnoitia besnoiti]
MPAPSRSPSRQDSPRVCPQAVGVGGNRFATSRSLSDRLSHADDMHTHGRPSDSEERRGGEHARLLEEGLRCAASCEDGLSLSRSGGKDGRLLMPRWAGDGAEDRYDGLPPVTLSFQDLTMDIVSPGDGPLKRSLKQLLQRPVALPTKRRILSMEGIHGCFMPGDCVALMGSSGAGKTTLLNVLSGRVTRNVGGVVKFNGHQLAPEVSKTISCFVQQEVMFFGALTVQEHLQYQAALRLPPSVSRRERDATIAAMIQKVGLAKVAHSRIGNTSQNQMIGVSGGEQRRLAVATELLTQPCVIFADEPTSGLDSYMAMQVVKLFKELASAGRTVVCTIHQPSSSVFAQFNKVVLMSEGHMLYCGDREACIAWFAHLGQICEADMNPAEFLMKICAVADENREAALQRTKEWADRWRLQGAVFLEHWETHGGRVAASSDQLHLQRLFSSLELHDRAPHALEGGGESSTQIDQEGGAELSAPPRKPSDQLALEVKLSGLSSPRRRTATFESLRRYGSQANAVSASELTRQLSSRAQSMLKGGTPSEAMLHAMQKDRVGIFREAWLQFKRSIVLTSRDPLSTYVKLVTTLISALIPAFLYFRLSWDGADAWNKVSSSFYVLMGQSSAALFGVSMAFNKERPIIQREYETGVVRMPLYFLGRVTADSILWMIFPFVYHLIFYWIVCIGGDSVGKYFASLAVLLLTVQAVASYSFVVVSVVTNPVVSTVVVQILQMILSLFSGFMVKLDKLNSFWVWLVYLSPFKYGLSCFTESIFIGATVTSATAPPIDGLDFLKDTFGFDYDYFWLYIAMLFVLGIGARLLGMCLLTWTARRTKENQ